MARLGINAQPARVCAPWPAPASACTCPTTPPDRWRPDQCIRTASEGRHVMPEPAASRYDGIRAALRPSPKGSARPPPAPPAGRRPSRIASIRMGLTAGIGGLVLLVIFIAQNTHAVHI